MAVIANRWDDGRIFCTTLISNRPLAERQVAVLRALTETLGFELLYAPGVTLPADSVFRLYLQDPEGFARSFRYNIAVPSDDRPFFFFTLRLRDALQFWNRKTRTENAAYFSLVFTLILVCVLVASLLGFPLWYARRNAGARSCLGGRDLVYFASLGCAFMLIEIALIQRLTLILGHPTYALTVVLFALFFSSGLGSYWAGIWCGSPAARRQLGANLMVLMVLLAAGWWGLPHLLFESASSPVSLVLRIALAIAATIPIGLLMGTALPVALHTIGERAAQAIPWALGVNGATSVFASVAAIVIAIQWGFSAAFGLGIAFYALALLTRPQKV